MNKRDETRRRIAAGEYDHLSIPTLRAIEAGLLRDALRPTLTPEQHREAAAAIRPTLQTQTTQPPPLVVTPDYIITEDDVRRCRCLGLVGGAALLIAAVVAGVAVGYALPWAWGVPWNS